MPSKLIYTQVCCREPARTVATFERNGSAAQDAARHLVLRSIGGERDPVQAETCDECRTYAKMLYRTRSAEIDPFADDLATVDLDVAASGAGSSRHAPNPPLLIGSGDERCRRSKI